MMAPIFAEFGCFEGMGRRLHCGFLGSFVDPFMFDEMRRRQPMRGLCAWAVRLLGRRLF